MPLVRGVDMHVHVDETGGEKPIPGVDHRGAGRDRRRPGGADRRHPIAVDHDGYWRSPGRPSVPSIRVPPTTAIMAPVTFPKQSYFQYLESWIWNVTNRVIHSRE